MSSQPRQSPSVRQPDSQKQKHKPVSSATKSLANDKHTFTASGSQFVVDSKYVPKTLLGTGAYGVVISAEDKVKKQKVAIKKVGDGFHDVIDAKRVLREVKMLRQFSHPNIVDLVDMIDPPKAPNLDEFKDIYLIFEYLETDLHKIIYSKNKLTDDHIQFFIYQMLAGLKYLHSAKVLHRDLKPGNLLLNSDCTLKICDFGLARGFTGEAKDDDYLTEYVVTRWYRAPEIMCSCQQYDEKIDVWATGCIFAELLGREPLFPGEDYIDQMKLIFKVLGTPDKSDLTFVTNENAYHFITQLPPQKPQSFSKLFPRASALAIDLLEKMLVFNPEKRLSVDEALAHPFLADLVNDMDNHKHEAKEHFDFAWEQVDLTNRAPIKALMYEEIRAFRPNMPKIEIPPPELKDWWKNGEYCKKDGVQ